MRPHVGKLGRNRGSYGGTGSYDFTSAALTAYTLPSGLTSSTVYYWRVQYKDNTDAWSEYSKETYFATRGNSRPNQPNNQSPTDGEGGVLLSPTLSADAFSDDDTAIYATEFHRASKWQISTQLASFEDNIVYSRTTTTDLTSHILSIANELAAGTYYWRVAYKDAGEEWSPPSTVTSFITGSNNRPYTPTNVSPTNGAINQTATPTLGANAFADPDGNGQRSSQWQVTKVSGDYSAANLAYDSGPVVAGNHAITTTLSGGTPYYWRVRYQDDQGAWSLYSNEWLFTTASGTGAAPNRPSNGSVMPTVDGEKVSLIPILNASPFYDSNADVHLVSRWQIRTLNGTYGVGASYELDSVGITNYSLPLTLTTNTLYYWQVQYKDDVNFWSNYSEETSFITRGNTKPDKPTDLQIDGYASGITGIGLLPTLSASVFSDLDTCDNTICSDAIKLPDDPNEAHKATWWQISTSQATFGDGSYQTTVDEFNTTTYLREYTLPVMLTTEITYYWHVKYQDVADEWSDWSDDASFRTGNNSPPNKPSNQTPTPGQNHVSTKPTLTSSDFYDLDGNDHIASQWQITYTQGDYSSPAYNTTTGQAELITHTLTTKLDFITTCYWRVRYQDDQGFWSLYSNETAFTTSEVPDGVVAHWKFDEDTGMTLFDSSGNNNHGILKHDFDSRMHNPAPWTGYPVGGYANYNYLDQVSSGEQNPTWTTGKYGSALYFGGGFWRTAWEAYLLGGDPRWTWVAFGTNAYVEVPDSDSLDMSCKDCPDGSGTGQLTIEAWIKPDPDQVGSQNNWWVDIVGKGNASESEYNYRLSLLDPAVGRWETEDYTPINGQYNTFADYIGFNFKSLGDWRGIVPEDIALTHREYKSGVIDLEHQLGYWHVPTWYHIVMVYDETQTDGEVKFYVDNVLRHTFDTTDGAPLASDAVYGDFDPDSRGRHHNPLLIGKSAMGSRYFQGAIDEMVIYNRVLTREEISERYGAQIKSIKARDILGGGQYIQEGDQVVIALTGETQGNSITAANIATVLQLDHGHSWFSSAGTIGSIEWTTTTYLNDTLIINLSVPGPNVNPPTVAVGDTVTLDGVPIRDKKGREVKGSGVITGDFDNQTPRAPGTIYPDDTTNASVLPELRAQLFMDDDMGFFQPTDWDQHQASHWQISTAKDDEGTSSVDEFANNVVYETGSVYDLIYHKVPQAPTTYESPLQSFSTYYWRVKYQDSDDAWSDYSDANTTQPAMSFTTTHQPEPPLYPPPVLSPSDVSNLAVVDVLLQYAGDENNPVFSDQDYGLGYGDYHEQSEWQISTSNAKNSYGTYTNTATGGRDNTTEYYDSGPISDLTSHVVDKWLATDTDYYWHIRYRDNKDAWSPWSDDFSFRTRHNNLPRTPGYDSSDRFPVNGKLWESNNPVLSTDSGDDDYLDPDGTDAHYRSRWQVATDAGFSNMVYDSTPTTDLTSHTVSSINLAIDTTYYWRVRYQDNKDGWSSWSTEWSFTVSPIPHGAVAYWRFDKADGSDTVTDSSILAGNATDNKGTIYGGASRTTVAEGRKGMSLELDGLDDYVVVANDSSITTMSEFTIEAWVKPSAWDVEGDARILSKDGEYEVFWTHSGLKTCITLSDTTITTTDGTGKGTVPLGEWTHIVVIFRDDGDPNTYSNIIDEYVNNVRLGRIHTATDAGLDDKASDLYLGKTASGNYFAGLVDEVVIYNRALAIDEIEARYYLYNGAKLVEYARAEDTSNQGPDIQAGDQVVINFDAATNGAAIDFLSTPPTIGDVNIDSVLVLSDGVDTHTWLDGNNNIGTTQWSTVYYNNDTLTVVLSNGTAPTVALGDTITLGGNVIEDFRNNMVIEGSTTIVGSFGMPPGLVGYWKFGETSGDTAKDSSGFENSGILQAGTSRAEYGKSGKALGFNGSDSYIEVDRRASLTVLPAVSVEAWIKPDRNVSHSDRIICKFNEYEMYWTYDGIKGRVGTTVDSAPEHDTTDGAVIPLDQWSHVLMTWGGSTIKQYVNGVLQDSKPFSGSWTYDQTSDNKFYIGSYYDDTSHFSGLIDEVAVYNQVLDSTAVLKRYTSASARAKLVGAALASDGSQGIGIQNGDKVVLEFDAATNGSVPAITNDNIDSILTLSGGSWVAGPSTISAVWSEAIYTKDTLTVTFASVSGSGPIVVPGDTLTLNVGIDAIKDAGSKVIRDSTTITGNFDLPQGVVGYWRFENDYSTATAKDDSGYGNDGTLHADTVWTPYGKFGSALEFDRDGDYVDCGNDGSLDAMFTAITVDAWIKPAHTTPTVGYSVVSKGTSSGYNNFDLNIEPDGKVSFWFNSDSAIAYSDDPLSKGTWHHIVGVWDGSETVVYLDGVVGTPVSHDPTGFHSSRSPVLIGSWNQEVFRWFYGSIDEVAIYNQALEPGDVQERYSHRKARLVDAALASDASGWGLGIQDGDQVVIKFDAATNGSTPAITTANIDSVLALNKGVLVAYWKFDENEGSTVFDSAGSNYGTLTGPPTWNTNGKSGSALSFAGANDYVNVGNLGLGIAAKTLEMWVKPHSIADDIRLISNLGNTSFSIRFQGGGVQVWGTSWKTVIASSGSTETWTHYTFVFDGSGSVTGYKNGVGETVQSVSENWDTTLAIGSKLNGSSGAYFDGLIDEVKVYNYALTEGQVQDRFLGLNVNDERSWVGGSSIISADWSDAGGNTNDTLTITFTNVDSVNMPTVAPGATITLDGTYIEDANGDGIVDQATIRGSFNLLAGGVAAYWKLDEGSGNIAYDSSGNENHGTLGDIALWTAESKYGTGALDFAGIGSWVEVLSSGSLELRSAITIEAWVKGSSGGFGDGSDGDQLNLSSTVNNLSST